MGKRGPPPTQIDRDEFDKLISYQCTQKEIADFFGISDKTLDAWCVRELGMKLSEVWDKRKSFGKVRLRKAQFNIVEKGGPGAATMAIYLDKKMFPDENPDKKIPDPPPLSGNVLAIGNGKKTFIEFCTTAGYPAPFPKQVEMQQFGFNETDPRVLLGARGYGKTDYVTALGTAYDIYLHGNESTNLIITKSSSRNTAIIQEIANALEANGVELEKQNATCVRIKGLIGKDHSVEAITIRTSMRGRHPKRVIMDDPVTEEDVSKAQRVLVKRKYSEAYKLCKNIVIIGQPAHADDLYAELRPKLKLMLVPHGEIPQLDADLEAMRLAGVDPHSIEMSYHLRVPVEGSMPFANIKYLDSFPTGDSIAFIDPSDGGDYTAITVLKFLMEGVVVYGRTFKRAWYHCAQELTEIMVSKGVRRVCVETNFGGSLVVEQLQVILKDTGIGVVGKHSDTNKHACIMAAGSYAHMIHLSRDSDPVYTEQVVKYEHDAEFDDAPDSLARCLEWIGLIRGKK